MYVIRNQVNVDVQKVARFEAWIQLVNQHLQQQPGFQRSSLLNSLGYPARYQGTIIFTDRQAAMTWARGPWLSFVAANPVNELLIPAAPIEAWEVIQSNLGAPAATGSFLAFAEITIDPAQAQAYEASRKQLLELFQKHGRGLLGGALARFLGGPNRYAISNTFISRADAEATANAPEIQRFLQANPASNFGGTVTYEFFEVVQVAVAATVASANGGAAVRRN